MPISKTAQVLKYFAEQYRAGTGKGIPRKLLVKMCYVSDLFAHEHWGDAITDLAYYRYDRGPYDDHIVDYIEELETAKLAEVKHEIDGDYEKKRLVDRGVRIAFDFSTVEQEVLDYVATNYLFMPMPELMEDVVYPSRPWKETSRRKEPLPMNSVDNEKSNLVGFPLEELLLAKRELEAGRFVTEF